MKIISLFLFVILSGCGESESIANGNQSLADTVINRDENSIQINRQLVNAHAITLFSTKCILLNDSLQKSVARISQSSNSDSINFLNHLSEEDILITHYAIDRDTLTCEVTFGTVAGRFFLGAMQVDENRNIILTDGPYKDLMGYNGRPVYYKRIYKIYIPPKTKINKVLFRWH
jgi:hypothetical protein